MNRKTKLASSAGAALAAVGAGGAIAATKLAPNEPSKAVVDDAAKQLGIEPQAGDGASASVAATGPTTWRAVRRVPRAR